MKQYTKQQREDKKIVLELELKPADRYQEKLMKLFLQDMEKFCLNFYYQNKNNEIKIGDNLKK
ncbi:hypothetical protein EOL94_04555 [bacterium]|nr:hypothetical protein [bacterium]